MSNPIPTKLPEWATAVGADIVEPALGQKQDGWDVDDKPPAGWMNWRANLAYQWLQWISQVQVKNWFQAPSNVPGSDEHQAVCFGRDYWVIGGKLAGDEIQVSKVGQVWQIPSGVIAFEWLDAFSNTTHVLLIGFDGATGGKLAWATDPIGAWTDNSANVPIPGTEDFGALGFGATEWVIADEDGRIYTATDPTGAFTGPHTTPSVTFGGFIGDVRYISRLALWLGVGNNVHASAQGLYTAPDPKLTWTNRTNPDSPSTLFHIADNGRYIFASGGAAPTTENLIRSTDLLTWVSKSSATPTGYKGVVRALVGDPSGNLLMSMNDDATNGSGIFLSRDDADSWELVYHEVGTILEKSWYDPIKGQFMFVGDDSTVRSLVL